VSRLVQIEGDRIVRQIPLKKCEYKLGRGVENDVVFRGRKVSRLHAVLSQEGDTYWVIDQDSANGVFVNGERVKRRRLSSGDEIGLSTGVTLLYLSDSDAAEKVSQMLNRMWEAINKKDFLRLKEVTSRIISLDSLDRILNIILREVVKLVDAERGFIVLTDEKGEIRLDTGVSHNIPLKEADAHKAVFSNSIVRRAVQNRENVFVLNTEDDEASLSNSVLELSLGSIMCSPLLFGNKPVGILYVDSGSQLSDFDEIDQFFFTIFSDHAAIAIENAKLYHRLQMSVQQLREEIQESEERYRQLVELSPEVVIVHSDGKTVFVNAAAIEAFGAEKPEDLLGKPVIERVHPDYRDIAQKRIRLQLEGGQQVPFLEEKFLRLDGSSFDVEVAATPLIYQSELAVLVIARDITERKRMERELLRAQKLESLGVLAGGIAHDFNNILTGIVGNISLARMRAQRGEDFSRHLGVAEQAAWRAQELTQQLLTFSRGGAPIRKTLSIAETIRESAEFVLGGANVRCEFAIPDDLWPVEADEGQISQVINNLVINADQAMPQGGIIRICAENVVCEATSELPLEPGRYIRISIRDRGIGIPEEHIHKVLDPYFTTKQQGSGLGLATAHSIIAGHDGYITLESELGVGTTVYIYLPASEKEVPAAKALGGKPIVGKGKILVMDDEEAIRMVASAMLAQLGYEVESAKTGSEAIELYKTAKEAGQPFDALIMDLTIPGSMGGQEALSKLLDIDPEVKAIVSSGYSNDPVMSNYRDCGFHGVVPKPYRMEELSKAVHRVIMGDARQT